MKIAGSYGSMIRGVSQQAPEVRVDGQHTEQVNMLSDPVAGLTRRRGTIFKASKVLPGVAPFTSKLAGFGGYREIEHSTGGMDYVILMRDQDSLQTFTSALPGVMCYNRTTNEWYEVSWFDSAQQDFYNRNGMSAAVSLGQYMLFGINNLKCTTVSATVWGIDPNHKQVVWIRGGAFNRTYTITLNTGITYSYTTPDAAAAGASLAITPHAIAASLGAALTAGGVANLVVGSHIGIATTWNGKDIAVDDGGDGSLIRGILGTVDSVDKLPLFAFDGQMMKIQTGPASAFYVKAFNKAGVGTSLGETIWREAAGIQQGATLLGLGKARILESTKTLYIGYTSATNPSGLAHVPTADTPPALVPAGAGDGISNPAPRWLSNQITMMALFQDRLLIGSGAEVAVSAAGDYLNFFRTTVVTVPVSDAFAMISQGGEDDTMRTSCTYNRNLVIFGDKRQYLISGSTALTPTAANMTVMTVYPDATDCRPVAAGGQIFYARNREGSVSVHQIQPGMFVESAESFPASAQIDTYIPAPACVMESVPGAPALLLVRTRSQAQSLYVFSYLDAPDGRKQEAWYRWEFSPLCGNLIGVKNSPAGLLLFWARQIGAALTLVADLMPMSTAASALPYLDSMRKATIVPTTPAPTAGWSVAFDNTSERYLIGGDSDNDFSTPYPVDWASSAWRGINFDSYVILTNPYARDNDKKALLSGRTVVGLLRVNTRASVGMTWEVTAGGAVKPGSYSGRRLGSLLNAVGKVPVEDSIVSIPIGRETRAYSIKIAARNWFPLNLIGIEWTGQSFNRTPRA